MRWLILAPLLAVCAPAWAQQANTKSDCNASAGYSAGSGRPLTMGPDGALCAQTAPSARTLVPLDITTVTTGGTAVAALAAGHRTKGGWIHNPASATINLCINEQGSASGTTSAGATTCIAPGQTYSLAPAAGAVSVISSDSSHPFSGMGFN